MKSKEPTEKPLKKNSVGDSRTWFKENFASRLLAKVQDFQERDSGWTMVEVVNLVVNINRFEPLRRGISTFIKLPQDIQSRKAVVNIENRDEYCFLWRIVAAHHHQVSGHQVSAHPERTSSYPDFNTCLKYDGINFPITLKDISKFKKMNNLSINVYGIESSELSSSSSERSIIVPFYLSDRDPPNGQNRIHLLLMENEIHANNSDAHQVVYHYAWIRNLSRLVSTQTSKSKHAVFICDRCLCHFKYQRLLDMHRQDGNNINKTLVVMPDESEKILSFKNHRFKESVPFSIYADLECILEPSADGNQNHIPHSVAFYVHCAYNDSLSRFAIRRGPNCIEWFIKQLQSLAIEVNNILKKVMPMEVLSVSQQEQFNRATKCHICEEPFSDSNRKHRDHCHFTGKYRGPAHHIPIVFHNLSGYDSHFIIKSVITGFEGAVSLLTINKEKYISFTKHVKETRVHLRFIDSYRFMASSIDKLASNLTDEDKSITRKFYSDSEEFK